MCDRHFLHGEFWVTEKEKEREKEKETNVGIKCSTIVEHNIGECWVM